MLKIQYARLDYLTLYSVKYCFSLYVFTITRLSNIFILTNLCYIYLILLQFQSMSSHCNDVRIICNAFSRYWFIFACIKAGFILTAFCDFSFLRFFIRQGSRITGVPLPRRMLILAPYGARISILRGAGRIIVTQRNKKRSILPQNAVCVNPRLWSYSS